MNLEELKELLPESQMNYPLKAGLYLRNSASAPCPDCPFRNKSPFVVTTKLCFQECPHDIMIWILSREQLEKYKELRPPEKKKKEIDRAIEEGKILQIERIKGAPEIAVAPLLFLKEIGRSDYFVL